jgi:chromosome segregation ATPase
MSWKTWTRRLLLAVAIGVVMVAGVLAQSGQNVAPAGSMREILDELRGLRADLAQAHRASQRVQLLGMRLQLQEQRISFVGRHLTDVQERLRANERAKDPLVAGLKMFEGKSNDETDKDELAHIIGPVKSQIAALEKTDRELRADEAEASRMLAEEQARWTNLNAQIEELERSLAAKAVR